LIDKTASIGRQASTPILLFFILVCETLNARSTHAGTALRDYLGSKKKTLPHTVPRSGQCGGSKSRYAVCVCVYVCVRGAGAASGLVTWAQPRARSQAASTSAEEPIPTGQNNFTNRRRSRRCLSTQPWRAMGWVHGKVRVGHGQRLTTSRWAGPTEGLIEFPSRSV